MKHTKALKYVFIIPESEATVNKINKELLEMLPHILTLLGF